MNQQLTKDFHISEFACKDGTPVPAEYYYNVLELAQNLQVLRDHIGEPLYISGSGFRTKTHNHKVGGADESQHLTASAGDISAKRFSPKELAETIEHLISIGKMKQGGIGIYRGFVHYDIRGKKVRWNG